MENNIYILSEAIRSGKTTELINFCNKQVAVGGILTPDVNGLRKIYFPSENKSIDFQIENEHQGINVGKFNFSEEAFIQARSYLNELDLNEYHWIVIDEIGKLELLSASGFEPELSELIKRFKEHKGNTKLLLVIRDSLLELGMEFYNIKNANVISISDLMLMQNEFKFSNDLLGVILCGGQSSRMGSEKFVTNYHGVPQYQYLSKLFKKLNLDTVISIREGQVSFVNDAANLVLDNEYYFNAGPLTGLLSVYEKYPDKSILLVGCDYPLLNLEHISYLIDQIHSSYSVVCFQNNVGIDEPLIAYYSNEVLAEIKNYFELGNKSLQQFIKSTNVKRLTLENNLFLTSVDTPLERAFILNQINVN
jgi:molybdenum cofactor guanylyltransferase